jgi:hypothetical protein
VEEEVDSADEFQEPESAPSTTRQEKTLPQEEQPTPSTSRQEPKKFAASRGKGALMAQAAPSPPWTEDSSSDSEEEEDMPVS